MEAAMNSIGLQKRLVAWIIDAAILIPLLLLIGVIFWLGWKAGTWGEQTALLWPPAWLLVSGIYVVGLWTWRGQTLGKIVMRIRIVKSDMSSISIGTAILRYIGLIAPAIIVLIVLLFVVYSISAILPVSGSIVAFTAYIAPILVILLLSLIITRDNKKQGLHDRIARTYVVESG